MNDYSVSIPVNCMNLEKLGREKILSKLKAFDAKRVFLNYEESLDFGGIYVADEDYRIEQMNKLRSAADFFKAEGYETAAWFWAFKIDEKLGFTRLCDFFGNEVPDTACPSDKDFLSFAADCVENVAKSGVELIAFNDDLRFGFFSTEITCLCENHIKRICEIVGENLSREELHDKIINGGENKYRNAYIAVNKEFLMSFATTMRKRVDSVNPSIRMGFCAAMSAWDIDGDAYELAKALAGNTKPFIRLIGAPYWAVNKSWSNRLQDVIELNRMEKSYFENKDIELIAEGDVWPRPRMNCPAAFLEGYDTALRAFGKLDGILKIALDYASLPDYEIGYEFFHVQNKPLYKRIADAFSGKENVGVRVYEYAEKFRRMKNPNEIGERNEPEKLFFSEAARTLTCNGIPTVYEGKGECGIVFGENARYIPRSVLKHGVILDTAAAAILKDRGVDIGIEKFGEKKVISGEYFYKSKNRIIAYNSPAYDIELNHDAEVLSIGITKEKNIPMSFIYKNKSGERFLIINTNPRENDLIMRHYERGFQYRDFIGEKMPATCVGNPDVYLLCSKKGDELTVGVWNFCIDPTVNAAVILDKEYRNVEFLKGNGTICGKVLQLDEIPAYGFAGFTVFL